MTRPGDQRDASRPLQHSQPREDHSPGLTPIARFLNAAEAGYFAHELKLSRNLPVTVQAEEDFDAVSGHWSTRFVLAVPTASAEVSARALQELVRQTEIEEYSSDFPAPAFDSDGLHSANSPPFDPFRSEEPFDYPQPLNWVPIVVTLAAGSLAFWGVKKLWEPARPKAAAPANAPRDVLWDMMRTPHGRQWVQNDAQGKQIRVLEFHGNEAILREDSDGDQIFEHTWRLHP